MSWEEMRRDEFPCSCGKGKIVKVMRMDDWNRAEYITTIYCLDCRAREDKRRYEAIERVKEKEEARRRAIRIAKSKFLSLWLQKFEGLSKKQVWEALPKQRYGFNSLSTFYKHVNESNGIEKYLEKRFEEDIDGLFPSEFTDKEVEELLAKSI